MGTIIKKAACVGVLVTLGACAPTSQYYGEAHAWNKAVQTINPAPVYTAQDAQPGDNGERAALAVERYRSGNVGSAGGGRGGMGGGNGGMGGTGGGFGGGSMGGLGAATGPR